MSREMAHEWSCAALYLAQACDLRLFYLLFLSEKKKKRILRGLRSFFLKERKSGGVLAGISTQMLIQGMVAKGFARQSRRWYQLSGTGNRKRLV